MPRKIYVNLDIIPFVQKYNYEIDCCDDVDV